VSPVGGRGTGADAAEKRAWAISGWFGVLGIAACVALVWAQLATVVTVVAIIVGVVLVLALVVVPPGRTQVVLFFGRYVGTVRSSGFWLVLPLTTRRTVSIRVRNFETNHLKVNDADGNPVEIAAMVSNLMVVLCGDQPASPIVNTGSLYS